MDDRELRALVRQVLKEWKTKNGKRVYFNNKRQHHGLWAAAAYIAGWYFNKPQLRLVAKEVLIDDLPDLPDWLKFNTPEQDEAEARLQGKKLGDYVNFKL